MQRISALWKANVIAFISSFCVMVIELVAGRILAPYIGVSLYTWTSIIGVILAGIALGNYLGGRLADRYPSPLVLVAIFLLGGLATVAILPTTKMFATAAWLSNLPVMWSFTAKIALVFFIPAFVLSMVSPLVIKLTLADTGRTGGVVGTIYACSTAGSILGTFMTGFLLISWFGTRTIVWLVAAVLVVTGILAWFSWKMPKRWKFSVSNLIIWLVIFNVVLISSNLFRVPSLWQERYTKESNYYAIQVVSSPLVVNEKSEPRLQDGKVLILDHLIHSYVFPGSPTTLKYEYENIFKEIMSYITVEKQALRVLHLGGGGYVFPRYLEAVYLGSVNEVAEIDPAVTEVAHEDLGLPLDTSIRTYNHDARLFLIERKAGDKYNIVIGDVFNDKSTPYHLTTLEFDRLVKANMEKDGVYLINIIDDYVEGRYMPAFVYTLRQVFDNVYLFDVRETRALGASTFVIAATDRHIDLNDYRKFVTADGKNRPYGFVVDEAELDQYLLSKDPILLTDDHAPTDILVAPLVGAR